MGILPERIDGSFYIDIKKYRKFLDVRKQSSDFIKRITEETFL
ncbi:MAG: hypothetical protein QXO40_04795 [Candidatus Aenigmatarchaeota archaeon]